MKLISKKKKTQTKTKAKAHKQTERRGKYRYPHLATATCPIAIVIIDCDCDYDEQMSETQWRYPMHRRACRSCILLIGGEWSGAGSRKQRNHCKNETTLKNEWCRLIKRVDGQDKFNVTSSTRICDAHFRPEDITTDGKLNRKQSAKPI